MAGYIVPKPVAALPLSVETAALLADAERHDGYPPLSEHKLVRAGGTADSIVKPVVLGDALMGLVVAARHDAADGTTHWAAEAVLGPGHRSPKAEREIVQTAAELVPDGEPHTIWAWRPAQVTALHSMGYRPIRRILRLERALPVKPEGPDDPRLSRFVSGADEERLIAVNNRAFAGHPEDGNMTPQGLAERMARPWFDPAGILLASNENDVIGFCWTKLQGEGLGEIYVIAVSPEARGRGVGSALLSAGLTDLYRRGAIRAMLWVESDNGPARALYAHMGFRPVLVNTEFAVPGTQPKR
jgi:mycothiol synthase